MAKKVCNVCLNMMQLVNRPQGQYWVCLKCGNEALP